MSNRIFKFSLTTVTYMIGIFLINSCFSISIIKKPINFNQKRINLTKNYLSSHYDIFQDNITISPKMIVIHCTETANFDEAFNYFYPPLLSSDRPELLKRSPLNVSAHYLVDRDGKIYQLMPNNWMARHVIGLDYLSIGIENVGCLTNSPLTKEQIKSNVELVIHLKKIFPNIKYLIGHYEYGLYRNTPLWKEKDKSYYTYKEDPGYSFMFFLRKKVENLGLLPRNTITVPKRELGDE